MDSNNYDCHYATIKDRLKPREKKIVDVSKRGYRKKEEPKKDDPSASIAGLDMKRRPNRK